MTPITTMLTNDLAYLRAQTNAPALTIIAVRFAVIVSRWSMLARTRRQLVDLDDHLLRDVGLEKTVALKEAKRTFWDG